MTFEIGDVSDEEKDFDDEKIDGNVPDLPPEYCHYKDEGCEFADACLDCPFPQCLYDGPRGKQRWLKSLRDQEIIRLFGSGERGVKELALQFGLSRRTIHRALKNTLSLTSEKSMDIKEENGTGGI